MAQRPTKKQKELLSFIDGFIKGNGYSPSFREIMRSLDYKSVSTVATHVNGLIARGWLIKRDNEARTLEVVGEELLLPEVQAATEELSVEQTIRAKIDTLKKDTDAHVDDIATLERTLHILGYEEDTELV